jgi:hypothetical protein
MRSARCPARLGHFTKRIKGLLDVLVSGVSEDLAEQPDLGNERIGPPPLRSHDAQRQRADDDCAHDQRDGQYPHDLNVAAQRNADVLFLSDAVKRSLVNRRFGRQIIGVGKHHQFPAPNAT